jgi:hypothetical protein
MDVGHPDNDEARAAQVLASAPETASPSGVSCPAASRPTDNDMLAPWTERI